MPAGARGGAVAHGFPHLATVGEALTALFTRVSQETVSTFPLSVARAEVTFADGDDLVLGVQRVARVMTSHLRLPDARIIVSFRDMEFAANVELASGPEYFVELNERFRSHPEDVGAALAHEVTHVYLHRLGLRLADERADEILTDTVATFLGAGWLLLDAYREWGEASQKFGYLTPEEFGYVMAKRADFFGEDPRPWFTSPQGYEAYTAGAARARQEWRRPPLAAAGWAGRRRYARDRRAAGEGRPPSAPDAVDYTFEGGPGGLRVTFPCPTCCRRNRLPVRGRVRARCPLCRTVLECDT
ncbi:hypothetical protein ACFV3R_14060 [Streptomyces sp. NPDC059740]|uniref:hypothetical protein n=1 Tax=Streptomyces sp. NPDC059740 TaxID=3346926 RepID=UPI0036510320